MEWEHTTPLPKKQAELVADATHIILGRRSRHPLRALFASEGKARAVLGRAEVLAKAELILRLAASCRDSHSVHVVATEARAAQLRAALPVGLRTVTFVSRAAVAGPAPAGLVVDEARVATTAFGFVPLQPAADVALLRSMAAHHLRAETRALTALAGSKSPTEQDVAWKRRHALDFDSRAGLEAALAMAERGKRAAPSRLEYWGWGRREAILRHLMGERRAWLNFQARLAALVLIAGCCLSASCQHPTVSAWALQNSLLEMMSAVPVPSEPASQTLSRWLAVLTDFVATHDRLPYADETWHGCRVGAWCPYQRGVRRRGLMPEECQQKLDAVPYWRWEAPDTWPQRLELLRQYVADQGCVPTRGTVYDGCLLGSWCGNQRAAYARGSLAAERVAALSSVPGWQWAEPDSWPDWLALLQRYVAEYGAAPAMRVQYEGEKLGSWCGEQRQKRKRGQLTDQQIQQLDSVSGWWWEAEDTWQQWLQLLQQYVQQGNSIPQLRLHTEFAGKKLGSWCSEQRQKRRRNELTEQQIRELDSVSGWWWEQDDTWWDQLDAVCQFAAQHGRLPDRRAAEWPLGDWCSRQRQQYKGGTLKEDRRIALEKRVPGWVWAANAREEKNELAWQSSLLELQQWVTQRGSLPDIRSNASLAAWCNAQRQQYKNRSMLPHRREALEAIDGWRWVLSEAVSSSPTLFEVLARASPASVLATRPLHLLGVCRGSGVPGQQHDAPGHRWCTRNSGMLSSE